MKFHPILVSVALMLGSTGLGNLMTRGAVAQRDGCADVQFIFARGSGEELNGPSNAAWKQSIQAALGDQGFFYKFYELGKEAHGGHRYPAIAVSGGVGEYLTAFEAVGSKSSWGGFNQSVGEGVAELAKYFSEMAGPCPNTKYVLGGYSQGAMVLSTALNLGVLDPEKIIYIATFGDPRLYLSEGMIPDDFPEHLPDACYGKNLSNYRLDVSDCLAYQGILGATIPYQTYAFRNKIGAWCHDDDIMCSSGMSLSDHLTYNSSGAYRRAANVIRQRIFSSLPKDLLNATPITPALRQVAFVVDSTESMERLLRAANPAITSLVNTLLSRGGQAALLYFKDLYYSSHDLVCDFSSCTADQINTSLSSIYPYGGGDIAESALSAIRFAMNQLNWSPGATKTIVLITDAYFHAKDYDGTTLEYVTQRSLEIDPINIYPVVAETYADYFTDMADQTSGAVLSTSEQYEELSDLVLNRPVVELPLTQYAGTVGDEFTFDASSSYSPVDETLRFDWDLDGDGIFEILDAGPTIDHTYHSATDTYIQVRATDESGRVGTMSAHLVVSETSDPLARISNLSAEHTSNGTIKVQFLAEDTKQTLLSINNDIAGWVGNEFELPDTNEDLMITLTPYSQSERRGVPSSIEIKSKQTPTDEPDPSPTPTTPPISSPDSTLTPDDTIQSPQSSQSPQTLQTASAPGYVSASPPAILPQKEPELIPLAPNTGAYNE